MVFPPPAGFLDGSAGKESNLQCSEHRRHRFNPWVRKIPWRRQWQLNMCSCLENPIDRGVWGARAHGVTKSWTQLRD